MAELRVQRPIALGLLTADDALTCGSSVWPRAQRRGPAYPVPSQRGGFLHLTWQRPKALRQRSSVGSRLLLALWKPGRFQQLGLGVSLEKDQEVRVDDHQFIVAVVQHNRLKPMFELHVLNTL